MLRQTKKLGEIVREVKSGFACAKTKRVEGGIVHLRTNNISSDGKLDLSTITKIPKRFVNEKIYSLKKGDILFNNTNSVDLVGKTLTVESDLPYAFSNHLTRIRVDEKVAVPKYVTLVFWKFWHEGFFAQLCTQWVNQAGVNQIKLEGIKIPLPSLEEQKRIVAKIEKLFAKLDEASRLRAEALSTAAALLPSALHQVFSRAENEGWRIAKLEDVTEINPSKDEIAKIKADTEVSFVPMSAVSEQTQSIERWEVRKATEVKKGYTYFKEGDVLFAKITPCMENGKIAIAKDLRNGIGFGSTEFHVVRAKERVLPKWLFYFLWNPAFRNEAKSNMTGTAGQQRVPADFLKKSKIPFPPIAEQKKLVGYLDALSAKARELQSLQETTADEFVALRESILAHELGSLRD